MTEAISTFLTAADAATAQGDLPGAIRHLRQAVALEQRDAATLMKLSAMLRASGDIPEALTVIEQALAIEPLGFSALLARAIMLERLGDPRSGEAFGRAVAQAPAPERIPPAMRAALEHARKVSEHHAAEVERTLSGATDFPSDPIERSRVERFISNAARTTNVFHQEPSHFHYPSLPEIEFHDAGSIAGIAQLEAQTADIRDEFQRLVAAEAAEMVPYIQYSDQVPLRQWEALNNSKAWTAIHLIQNGRTIEKNANHCPMTMAALRSLSQPEIEGACPNAMFSLLAPKTRIPPHTGVANTRLVCHLPLIVPEGCGFRVGASQRCWQEGHALLFDDTIEHEAWNDSDLLRVVLIFDLWAPALSESEQTAIASIIPAMGAGFSGAL